MINFSQADLKNEDGYELWLRYHLIDDASLLEAYRATLTSIVFAVSIDSEGTHCNAA